MKTPNVGGEKHVLQKVSLGCGRGGGGSGTHAGDDIGDAGSYAAFVVLTELPLSQLPRLIEHFNWTCEVGEQTVGTRSRDVHACLILANESTAVSRDLIRGMGPSDNGTCDTCRSSHLSSVEVAIEWLRESYDRHPQNGRQSVDCSATWRVKQP